MGRPECSILIPVHNGLELTRACLASLWEHAAGGPSFEVIVFDDRSTDGTSGWLDGLGDRVRVLRGSARGGFAINNNLMAAEARGRHLVMLNNDTVCRAGWLGGLMARADDPGVGVVGNLHLYPVGGRVNHAGVVFEGDGRPRHLYEGMPGGLEAARARREMQAVCAACWLVPGSVFERLGGFDEGYRNGHEDIDFCLRAREAGLRVVYEGSSVIEHHGSATPGRFVHLDENERRFLDRWGGKVEVDARSLPRAEGVRWPRDGLGYRVSRGLWRAGLRRVLSPIVSSRVGTRVRSGVLRALTRGRG